MRALLSFADNDNNKIINI